MEVLNLIIGTIIKEKRINEVFIICKIENETSRKTILRDEGVPHRTFTKEGKEKTFYIGCKLNNLEVVKIANVVYNYDY